MWQKKTDESVETMMIITKGDSKMLIFDNKRILNKLKKRICRYQNK